MPPAALTTSFSLAVLPASARAVIVAAHTAGPTELAALGQELAPYLREIPDPRGRQGRRYALVGLLALCLVGFCTGSQGYLSVARWARFLKLDVLQALGFPRGRTPCAATWLNLFRVLDW